MAKSKSKFIRRETKVRAPEALFEEFDRIMEDRGCQSLSEKYREAMRIIVNLKANGVANSNVCLV